MQYPKHWAAEDGLGHLAFWTINSCGSVYSFRCATATAPHLHEGVVVISADTPEPSGSNED